MAQILIHAVEQGLLYGIAALGVFITYRILNFPDLTVDGSFVTGAAIASSLLVLGFDPLLALGIAFLAGTLAGTITGLLNTRLGITDLLARVLSMIMLYSINLRIMGRPNISLLRTETIIRQVEHAFSLLGGLPSSASPRWSSWRSSSGLTSSSRPRSVSPCGLPETTRR